MHQPTPEKAWHKPVDHARATANLPKDRMADFLPSKFTHIHGRWRRLASIFSLVAASRAFHPWAIMTRARSSLAGVNACAAKPCQIASQIRALSLGSLHFDPQSSRFLRTSLAIAIP